MKRVAWIALTTVIVISGVVLNAGYRTARQTREALFAEFTPVSLSNCTLERFGDANDGGYPLCGNLLQPMQAAYSYGINGTDNWGCAMASKFAVDVHQYDCFNLNKPACTTGATHFNAECVGTAKQSIDGRPFDTVLNQVAKNGDTGKHLVIKMDVEGAEWTSLLDAPDALLNNVDQLIVEFHKVEDPHFLDTVRRLKQLFHVVHVHQNNFGCEPGLDPFPSSYFEVLLVNRRVAQVGPATSAVAPGIDAPNAAWLRDCQAPGSAGVSSNLGLFRRWLRRASREHLPALGL